MYSAIRRSYLPPLGSRRERGSAGGGPGRLVVRPVRVAAHRRGPLAAAIDRCRWRGLLLLRLLLLARGAVQARRAEGQVVADRHGPDLRGHARAAVRRGPAAHGEVAGDHDPLALVQRLGGVAGERAV